MAHSIDDFSLMIQDSHRAELHLLPDGDYMLYAELWRGQAPLNVGVKAEFWESFKIKYPKYAEKVEIK